LGYLLALRVSPANEDDRKEVEKLSEQIQKATGENVELAYVDQEYTGEKASESAAEHGIRLEVVKHEEAKGGFVLLPRRWVVERDFAWASVRAGHQAHVHDRHLAVDAPRHVRRAEHRSGVRPRVYSIAPNPATPEVVGLEVAVALPEAEQVEKVVHVTIVTSRRGSVVRRMDSLLLGAPEEVVRTRGSRPRRPGRGSSPKGSVFYSPKCLELDFSHWAA
jgi:transposase